MQNRGRITPQPQGGVSYLSPNTPAPPAPPFPPPVRATQFPLFLAAGAAAIFYFPANLPRPTQTLGTAMIAAAA